MNNFDELVNSGMYSFATLESSQETFQELVDYVNSVSYDDAKKILEPFNTFSENYNPSATVVLNDNLLSSYIAESDVATIPPVNIEFSPKSQATFNDPVVDGIVEKIQSGQQLSQSEISTLTENYVFKQGFYTDTDGSNILTSDICTPDGDVIYSFKYGQTESDVFNQVLNVQKNSLIGVTKFETNYFGSDKTTYNYILSPPNSDKPITITTDEPISGLDDIINKYHDFTNSENVSAGGNHWGLNSSEEYQKYINDLDKAIQDAKDKGIISEEDAAMYDSIKDTAKNQAYDKFSSSGVVPTNDTYTEDVVTYGDTNNDSTSEQSSNTGSGYTFNNKAEYGAVNDFFRDCDSTIFDENFDYEKIVNAAKNPHTDSLDFFFGDNRVEFEENLYYAMNDISITEEMLNKQGIILSELDNTISFTDDELALFQVGGHNLGTLSNDFNQVVNGATTNLNDILSEVKSARSNIAIAKMIEYQRRLKDDYSEK